jgi:hypothetical protein
LIHLSYVGTLLPLGVDVLRLLLRGVRRLCDDEPGLAGRLRLHFIGTSNQPAGAGELVMPHAAELGVADLVSEHPARVGYVEALSVLQQSSGILLLGSTESHYTPSKAFPALLAGRPLLALYHADSPIVDIVRRVSPMAQVVTYESPIDPGLVTQVVDGVRALIRGAGHPVPVDRGVLEAWSALSLARQLAAVCDRIAA